MKYCQGTDSRRKDLLLVWGNRIMAGIFALLTLFFLSLGCFGVAIIGFTWETAVIFLCAGISIVLVLAGIWGNSRYELGEDGIRVASFLKKRSVRWTDIQEIGIFPVIETRQPAVNYILIYLQGENIEHHLLNTINCWVNSDDMLAIRCTDERLEEFEKVLDRKIQRHIWNGSSGKYEIKQDEGKQNEKSNML